MQINGGALRFGFGIQGAVQCGKLKQRHSQNPRWCLCKVPREGLPSARILFRIRSVEAQGSGMCRKQAACPPLKRLKGLHLHGLRRIRAGLAWSACSFYITSYFHSLHGRFGHTWKLFACSPHMRISHCPAETRSGQLWAPRRRHTWSTSLRRRFPIV